MAGTRCVGFSVAQRRDCEVDLFQAIHRYSNLISLDVPGNATTIKDNKKRWQNAIRSGFQLPRRGPNHLSDSVSRSASGNVAITTFLHQAIRLNFLWIRRGFLDLDNDPFTVDVDLVVGCSCLTLRNPLKRNPTVLAERLELLFGDRPFHDCPDECPC